MNKQILVIHIKQPSVRQNVREKQMEVFILLVLCIVIFALAFSMFVCAILAVMKLNKINAGTATANRGKRFEKLIPFAGDFDSLGVVIDTFLKENQYSIQNYGGETVYRYGAGMFLASRFIKVSKHPQGIVVEAFIIAFLFFFLKELGKDGFFGIAAKRPLKKTVDQLISIIESHR
jgi:hypothetical protein